MNEREAYYEAKKFGSKDFDYDAVDGAEPEGRLPEDVQLNMAVADAYELANVRSAMNLCRLMMAISRTAKAGKLRILAAQNFIFGEPTVDEIAMRMKVTPRRVRQTIREVRCHCTPFLKFHHRRCSKFPRISKF